MKSRSLLVALFLLAVACSDGATATTTTTTTTTTTLATTTTTTEPATTTTEATTTTTVPEETTTTTEVTGDTLPGEETTTTVVEIVTATTLPPADADPDLIPWAGLFRQPTAYGWFLDLRSNGEVRTGTSLDALDLEGRWDYDEGSSEIRFTDFDFGDGCDGAAGRYLREAARGGGRRLILVDDPCAARAAFLVEMAAPCQCLVYLRVDQGE